MIVASVVRGRWNQRRAVLTEQMKEKIVETAQSRRCLKTGKGTPDT